MTAIPSKLLENVLPLDQWYVVQTQVKKESEVQEGLLKKGYKVFLPQYKKKAKRGPDLILPLFPGYLFTTFDRDNRQWQEISRIVGVARLLGYDAPTNTVCSVREGFVEALQQHCDERDIIDMNAAYPAPAAGFQQGDAVQILSGMFEGKTATYWNNTKNGAMLILSLLNRPIRVILKNEEITRGHLGDTKR